MIFKKEERNLKGWIKRSKNFSFSMGLMVAFLITGGISYANTGIALTDEAISIGKGALSTGKSTIAVGNGSFASGDNITKEEYLRLISENEAKLAVIQGKIDANVGAREELDRLRAEHSDIARKIENLKGLRNNLADKESELANRKPILLEEIERKRTEAVDYTDKINLIKSRLDLIKNLDLDRYSGVEFEDKLNEAVPILKQQVEDGLDFLPSGGIDVEVYKDLVRNVISDEKLKVLNKKFEKLDNDNNITRTYESVANYKSWGYYNRTKKDIIRFSSLESSSSKEYLSLFVDESNLKYQNIVKAKKEVEDKYNDLKEKYTRLEESDNDLYKKQKLVEEWKNFIKNNENSNIFISTVKENLTKNNSYNKYEEYNKYFKLNSSIFIGSNSFIEIPKYFIYLFDDNEIKNSEVSLNHGAFIGTLENFENFNKSIKENVEEIEKINKIKSDTTTYFDLFRNKIIELEGLERTANEIIRRKTTEIEGYEAEIRNLQSLIASSSPEDIEGIKSKIETKENAIRLVEEEIKNLKKELTIVSKGENAIANGKNAVATGKNSISFGTNTFASGENSLVLGTESTVVGTDSLAIGTGHTVNGVGSTTMGDPNQVYGDNNHVYGNNNNIGTTDAKVNDNFILGSNITSTVNNAIVLGNKSTAVANAVSVGSKGNERKIVNVADGEISTLSTDVINGRTYLSFLNKNVLGKNNKVDNIEELKSVIIGGENNKINSNTEIAGGHSSILGGRGNTIAHDYSNFEFSNARMSSIVGGESNTINSSNSLIGGGEDNSIYKNSDGSIILGGRRNRISNYSYNSTILGGDDNSIYGTTKGVILGGANNKILYSTENHSSYYNGIMGIDSSIEDSTNTILIGFNSKAKNVHDAIVLGNNAKAVSNAISVGDGENHNYKIVNLKDGIISATSKEAINGSQLYGVAKGTDTNIDVAKWKSLLGVGNVDLSSLNGKFDEKSNKNLDNLTTDGEAKIKTLAKESVKVINGNHTTVTVGTEGNIKTYAVNVDLSSINTSLSEKADSNAITQALNTKANKDLENITEKGKTTIKELAKESVKVVNGTNTTVTVGEVNGYKTYAVNVDLSEVNTTLDEKVNKDLNNISTTGENKIKEVVATNHYTKKETDTKLDGKVNKDLDNISKVGETKIKELSKDTVTVKGGTNVKVTKNVTKENTEFVVNADLTNYYNKAEVDKKVENIVSGEVKIDGEVNEKEERAVKGKVIDKHLKENYVNKAEMQVRDAYIVNNYTEIQRNREMIQSNSQRIRQLDDKINKTQALAEAKANLKYGNMKTKQMSVGAGIGNYMGKTAVAVGVAYKPSDNFMIHANWGGLAGEPHYNSVGGGFSLIFDVK